MKCGSPEFRVQKHGLQIARSRHSKRRRAMAGFPFRSELSLLCSGLMMLNLFACSGHRATLPEVRPIKAVFEPLQEDLKKSYVTLFEIAPTLEYSDVQIATMKQYLEQAQDYC